MDCNEMPPILLSYAANEEELLSLQHTADILFCNHAHTRFTSFEEALACTAGYLRANRLRANFAALKCADLRDTFSTKASTRATLPIPDGMSLKQFSRLPFLFSIEGSNTTPKPGLTPASCTAQKLLAVNISLPDDSDDITWQARKGLMHKWRRYLCKIYQSIYAQDTDEERLCTLRLELFLIYLESFRAKWHIEKLPEAAAMEKVAWIIAWNTFAAPSKPANVYGDLFASCYEPETQSTKVMKWESREPLKGRVIEFAEWLKSQKRLVRM